MVNWGFGPVAHMGMSSVPGMQPLAICRAIMSANPLDADLQACADYSGGTSIATSLSVPCHCILATQDKMTPLKSGKILAADMGCGVSIIDGYGHMLPLEAPKKTLAAIRQFIESVESQRATA